MFRRFVAGEHHADVHIALVKIPIDVGGGEAHFHVGEAAFKIMQSWDEPFQGDCDIDLDGQFIVEGGGFDGFGVGLDHVESVFDGGIIGLADCGQFCAAGVTAEQRKAHAIFQEFDLMADGGARDAKFGSGGAEGTQPCGGFKGCEGAEGWQVAFGQVGSPWVGLVCDNIGEMAGVVRIIYAGGGEIGAGGAEGCWAEWCARSLSVLRLRRNPPLPQAGEEGSISFPRPLAGEVDRGAATRRRGAAHSLLEPKP